MSEKINVLIAESLSDVRESAKLYFSYSQRIKVVGECSNGDDTIKLAKELKPDVMLIDADLTKINGINVTEYITATMPDVLVIITFSENSSYSIKDAMAAGAREYINKPFIMDSLIDTVTSLYEKEQKRKKIMEDKLNIKNIHDSSKIVTVFSTKGGVGKSTIASNLAISIAKSTNEKVVLIDLDLQFGDLAVMLNIMPERTIADLIKEIQTLDSEMIEDYLMEYKDGVKVLAAPPSPEFAEYVTPLSIEKILRILLQTYRYIVIDTAPSFQDINLTVLDISDYILFLTTLDLPTIKNVKAGLHIMDTLKYSDEKVKLVLNRYHRQYNITPSDLEKTTNKQLLSVIPEDSSTVIQAINEGIPFVIGKSKKPVSRSIQEINNLIVAKKTGKKSMTKLFKKRA